MINWSGVHGGQIKYIGCDDISITSKIKEALPEMIKLKEKVSKIINDIPCYIIEDKGLSFALHYRRCKDKDLIQIKRINSILSEYIKGKPIEFMKMKKVIEIKPEGINKGIAVEAINRKYKENIPSINICIGDDLTDEYLFGANTHGVNIKVGANKFFDSEAEYFLKDIKEVHQFLEILCDL